LDAIGALLSFQIFEVVDYYWLNIAIAASGGTFIYLAFFDFLPAITRRNNFNRTHTYSACLGGSSNVLFPSLVFGYESND